MEKEVLDRYEEIKERHKTRMDYGVKGMKWGDHKSEASNGGTDLSDVYSRIEKDQEEAKKRGISLGEYYRSTDFIKKMKEEAENDPYKKQQEKHGNPQQKRYADVLASGNKWAAENWNATH